MSPKLFLLLMTLTAVIDDSLLHPFFPQYFAQVFGVHDPRHVGYYIGACSLTVLLCFPLWAALAKRVRLLPLLLVTQALSALFSLVCYATHSLAPFWLASLAMLVFKASYLLVYPHVMRLSAPREHLSTISLLAFVVYFGNVLSAAVSGAILEWLDARSLFAVMALGDLVQIALCCYALPQPQFRAAPPPPSEVPAIPARVLCKLGGVMLVLYFSAYLSEPFFSVYWETLSARDNKLLSGMVFAIPAFAALLALYVNSRENGADGGRFRTVLAIALAVAGLCLQLTREPWIVLTGRFVYGWALFQSMVRLDAVLFKLSTPERYALDFSLVNSFQGLGVLLAGTIAGSLVRAFGVELPFIVAAAGFMLGLLLCTALLSDELEAQVIEQESAT